MKKKIKYIVRYIPHVEEREVCTADIGEYLRKKNLGQIMTVTEKNSGLRLRVHERIEI
jgi:hypothetical protein